MDIGINVMSSIGTMKEDFQGTLKKLVNGGCSFLELMSDWGAKQETIDFYASLTGGPSGWDPENTLERLQIIRSLGMDAKGMFVFDEMLEEQAEDLGKYCKENGIFYVVISFLNYGNIDDIYEKIGLIRRTAAILEPYKVQIVQHNHEHDVIPITDRDGIEKPIIDVFLEQLLPQELMLEVDTGWLQYAGVDPAARDYILRTIISNYDENATVLISTHLIADVENVLDEAIFLKQGKIVLHESVDELKESTGKSVDEYFREVFKC